MDYWKEWRDYYEQMIREFYDSYPNITLRALSKLSGYTVAELKRILLIEEP
jgi:2-iminoacetate synthase ThiH